MIKLHRFDRTFAPYIYILCFIMYPENETPIEEKIKQPCPNCGKSISAKAKFCAGCGQKQTTGKVSLSEMLRHLWETTFHLDNKLFRTGRRVLIPAELTLEYFNRRHKRYFHPFQVFFLSLFAVFLLVSVFSKSKTPSFRLFEIFGSGNPEYVKGKLDLLADLKTNKDSLPNEMQGELTKTAIDTLLARAEGDMSIGPKDSISFMLITNSDGSSKRFSSNDLLHISSDSLIQLYQVEGFLNRFVLRQTVSVSLKPDEFNRYWAGNLSWTFLLLSVVMAFWLKLLYRRTRQFYVEHFVLMLHLHAGLFIAFGISLILRKAFHLPQQVILFFLLWLVVGFYIAFKRYYQQPHWKTALKLLIFHVLYLTSFVFLLLGSMGAALLLF